MMITVENASGIHDNEAIDNISIYPNPTKGIVYINAKNTDILSVEVYDLHGRLLFIPDKRNMNEINIASYNPGIYILKINTDKQSVLKRLILE